MIGDWWHNPERASLTHFSFDGETSLCQKEFNSEWVVGTAARHCKSCVNYTLHLLERP
jgi:hypothetical protein